MKEILWSLLLLLSYFGWGQLLKAPESQNDSKASSSLTIIWGISFTYLACGLLLLIPSSLTTNLLEGWVALGALLGSLVLLKRGGQCRNLRLTALDSVFFVSAAFILFLAYGNTQYNCFDDFLAYIPMAKKLATTGEFSDPFSLRRLTSHGGQVLMDAFLLLHVPVWHINLLEQGICKIIVALLIREFFTANTRLRKLSNLLGIAFLFSQPPGQNIAPEVSGLMMVLGFLFTLKHLSVSKVRNIYQYGVPAIVGACLLGLRANYIVGFLPLICLFYHFEDKGKRAQKTFGLMGLTLLFLSPWMVLLYHSSGTIWFPWPRGNLNASYGSFTKGADAQMILNFLWQSAQQGGVMALLLLAGLHALIGGRNQKLVMASVASAVFMVLVVGGVTLNSEDPGQASRYSYAFTHAAGILLCLEMCMLALGPERENRTKLKKQMAWVGFCLALVMYGIPVDRLALGVLNPGQTVVFAKLSWEGILAEFSEFNTQSLNRNGVQFYGEVQKQIPLGATVLSITDMPFHFNYQKNKIWHLDFPGHVSPAPGIPLDERSSDSVIDAYLMGTGIEYIVFNDPKTSICNYNSRYWEDIDRRGEWVKPIYYHYWAPYYLRLFKYLDGKKRMAADVTSKIGDLYLVRLK